MHSIGIDIGGTKIAGALVDANGNILQESKVPSPADSADGLVAAVVDLVQDLSLNRSILGVGV
ncbi:MAG: hypothetical protein RI933_1255, partial [Actinomycetota bacterium]